MLTFSWIVAAVAITVWAYWIFSDLLRDPEDVTPLTLPVVGIVFVLWFLGVCGLLLAAYVSWVSCR